MENSSGPESPGSLPRGATPEALTPSVLGTPLPMRAGVSIVASAKRLTSNDTRGGAHRNQAESWQEDAWDMYDLVGEQRFLADTLANRMGQARLFIGKVDPTDTTAEPEPVEDEHINDLLEVIGGSPAGRAQIIQRMGVNLFVAGDGWIAGIPKDLLPVSDEDNDSDDEDITDGFLLTAYDPNAEEESGPALTDLVWKMLSVSEVNISSGGDVRIMLGEGQEERVETTLDKVYMIRVWRPHPRRSWDAGSPTRSSLPVLRELVGLTMHISAQVDSRLAGAGVFIVPQSASRAMKIAAGLPEDSADDPFTDALLEAMITPISDRSNASALVPLVIVAPDESTGGFQHITFAKPLDTEARSLRDEAIRRLALGQDAPPELLLGTAGMNHWGAWLVREDVVKTHIEPPLALICDAITTQYLRPVLIGDGMDPDEAAQYVIWYSVEHLIVRPNRGPDSITLFDKGLVSDATAREANGFDESDAPGGTAEPGLEQGDVAELRRTAGQKAIELAQASPELLTDPGLQAIAQQVFEVMSGRFSPQDQEDAEAEEAVDTAVEAGVSPDAAPATPPAREPAGSPAAPPPRPSTRRPSAANLPSTAGAPAKPPGFRLDGFDPQQIIEAFATTEEGRAYLTGYVKKFGTPEDADHLFDGADA